MKPRFFSALYQGSAAIAFLSGRKRKFMNLGYAGSDEFAVRETDKKDAHHISLYHLLIGMKDNQPDSALEIGCGRGGGSYVMKNYFNIPAITAVDLSSGNIRLASRLVPGVTFITADAVHFRTGNTFDLIVNLESSHRYSSREIFFRNVSQMMNSNSSFVFGDMIRKSEETRLEEMMNENGLIIIKKKIVNEGVVRSIEKNSSRQYPLATKFPFLFPRRIHSFFVTIHSRAYKKLRAGETLYSLYLLKRKG
ncbi:MAG: class I SAM-dependent methyltransferase [Bacteroidia bacterium]